MAAQRELEPLWRPSRTPRDLYAIARRWFLLEERVAHFPFRRFRAVFDFGQ